MSDLPRRDFLTTLAALSCSFGLNAKATASFREDEWPERAPASRRQSTGKIRLGCAAITWGGNDDQAIEEIAQAGYEGIQLRATAFDRYGTQPAALKALLAKHRLAFPVLSSGNLKYGPADRQAQLDLHLAHAKFVRDAGGEMLQVIDEKPKDHAVGPGDYEALADMMNTLGEKTKALGVALVYHHHMNSTGEPPAAIEAILKQRSAAAVGLLFDIAHYQQGGGDPVEFIRRYGKAIKVVHLKDVRPIDAAPGYQFVELGRGRVDVTGCIAALKEVRFEGWAIVELDRVVDADGSPKASAVANRAFALRALARRSREARSNR